MYNALHSTVGQCWSCRLAERVPGTIHWVVVTCCISPVGSLAFGFSHLQARRVGDVRVRVLRLRQGPAHPHCKLHIMQVLPAALRRP